METLWALRWSRLSLIPVSIDEDLDREQFYTNKLITNSEIELHRELNDARVIARRDDASEIAGVDYQTGVRINAAARRRDGVEVADRVGKVHVIEEIEELGAELDVL